MLTHELRPGDAQRIVARAHATGRAPVLFVRADRSILPRLTPSARLVSYDCSVGQVVCSLRRELRLSPGQAVFMFAGGGTLLTGSTPMASAYASLCDTDELLRVVYQEEDAFG